MHVKDQIHLYHRMKKAGELPERRVEVTLDGKIIDTVRKKDSNGNEVFIRAMRRLEPHNAIEKESVA